MPDYANPSTVTLVFGQGSSGKTTFAIRYLLNAPGVACRFIFDDRGQVARRLGLKWCGTVAQCEAAVATRWVCFNPHLMFAGAKIYDALRWFAAWSLQVSARGPGEKIFFVDEAWQWWDGRNAPPEEIQNLVRTGRFEHLQFLSATHSPREYHADIRRLVTEWVGFNTVEKKDLEAIKDYWPGVEKVKTLPRGEFISYFRETAAEVRGKLF
jgi:hypothetical protein